VKVAKTYVIVGSEHNLVGMFLQTVYDNFIPFSSGLLFAKTGSWYFLILLIVPVIANWNIVTKKIIKFKS